MTRQGAFFLRWNGPGDPNDDTSQAARSVMVVRVGDTVAAVSIPAMYDRAGVNDEAPTDLVELALRAHERLVAIQDELD